MDKVENTSTGATPDKSTGKAAQLAWHPRSEPIPAGTKCAWFKGTDGKTFVDMVIDTPDGLAAPKSRREYSEWATSTAGARTPTQRHGRA